jgi:hypothetical protein
LRRLGQKDCRAPIEMSSQGQNAKYSVLADVFCFASELGRRATQRAVRICAMCGRLRVGKSFLHVLQHWSVQPCVRPINAVHMTAGHNALRGSGPDQQLAFKNAMARVGCPDRRIDRLCITCCSPSQPSYHASCPTRFRYRASAKDSLHRSPLAIMAQTIRAILLASAIAATLVGRRASKAVSQGRCLVPWILA